MVPARRKIGRATVLPEVQVVFASSLARVKIYPSSRPYNRFAVSVSASWQPHSYLRHRLKRIFFDEAAHWPNFPADIIIIPSPQTARLKRKADIAAAASTLGEEFVLFCRKKHLLSS